jgi:NSS family neurotransmitter:Na+ symporter
VGHIDFLLNQGWLQFALASVHISFVILIVSKEIHEGIEKWIGYMMPVFLFLVSLLIYRALSSPSTSEVLRFLFYPDFSKLSFSSLNQAIGHVFFTLSLGFGLMVTFGSYLKSEDHTPTFGFRVTMVDTLVSLAALLLVFPLAYQAFHKPTADPATLFEVLPQFITQLPGGLVFGTVFFLCLYLAALNASLGLLEGIVSNAMDYQTEKSRVSAVWISGFGALLLSLIPALASNYFRGFSFAQRSESWIETVDLILINWILPLVALGVSLVWIYGTTEKEKEQLFKSENHLVSTSMYPYWIFAVKYLAPSLIGLGFLLQILDFFV